MKAFLIGLLFLFSVVMLSAIGLLLFPLLIAMVWILRIFIMCAFIIFAIWLLGKFIMFVWDRLIR